MFLTAMQDFIDSLKILDYVVLLVNISLIVFAHPILKLFSHVDASDKVFAVRVNLLRGLNLAIIVAYGYLYLYIPAEGGGIGLIVLSILAILYLCYFANHVLQYFIFKQYGKLREIGDKKVYIETYQTRLLSLLTTLLLTIIAIIWIVQQLGFTSMLEAGGVIGFLGVMLGLTQSSWAPDVISGLIILNSDMLAEGDVVEFDNGGVLGLVYKTKMFHTEILNLGNNHRIMMKNALLRDKIIHNLSKFASSKGLRECLQFNISYDVAPTEVRAMFKTAYERAQQENIPFEYDRDLEVKLLKAGDHSLTWALIFYVKQVEHIINIRRDLREVVLVAANEHGISLATPTTLSADVSLPGVVSPGL